MVKPVIISDFDGTISKQDVNDTIHTYYGDEKTFEIEEKFTAGEIGCYDSLSFHYGRLKIKESEFINFVKENIEIDPAFKDFYNNFIQKNNLKFAVVSGGFINYIEIIFDKYNIKMEAPVYANKLNFKGKDIEVNFLHDIKEEECHQDFGICGNCKYKIMKKYQDQNSFLIYIGDGLTDRCAAQEADLVLAKKNKSLAEYCNSAGFDFFIFKDFKEVKSILKNIFKNNKFKDKAKEENKDELSL